MKLVFLLLEKGMAWQSMHILMYLVAFRAVKVKLWCQCPLCRIVLQVEFFSMLLWDGP